MSRNSTTFPVPAAPVSGANTTDHPTQEDIAFRAHQIFVERGAAPGQDLDDWLQAERELTAAAETSSPALRAAPPLTPLANPRVPR